MGNENTGEINGEWLLLALIALGESQASAAAKMGKGRGHFTKHLNGSSFLKADSLALLARTFPTLNIRYVLTGEGSPLL